MRISLLGLLVLSSEAFRTMGAMLEMPNVPVVEIDENTKIDKEEGVIRYKDNPNSRFQKTLNCKEEGDYLVLSNDGKFATCCPLGQALRGSKETAFDCCAADHDVTGSQDVGYGCCATGEKWNGTKCKSSKPDVEKLPCTSGIEAGKCYTFTFPNGRRWGYNGAYYAAAPEEMGQQWGKFKLCKDEDCVSGAPVNPGDSIRIKDVHGKPKTGQDPNQWLSREINGGHIGKTPSYSKAGIFSLTKWPCGKYCLGGIEEGVAFACPNDKPAATFTTYDKQSCIPLDLLEVPCDIHAKENNCIWRNGSDQCCNKMDCSHVISNNQSSVA